MANLEEIKSELISRQKELSEKFKDSNYKFKDGEYTEFANVNKLVQFIEKTLRV